MASSSSKKRKADKVTSSPSRSSKKKSSGTNTSTSSASSIRVEVSPNDPDHDPIVVSFPRGVPSSVADSSGSSDTDNGDAPRFTCTRLKASSSRGRRIEGEDENCTYSATASGRGHDGRLTKAYVCVYNKRTKTLKLVPAAEKGTVFALDQAVKDYTPNVANGSLLVGSGNQDEADGEDGEDKTKVMSASDRVQQLVESFGSKKKQKVMASRAANKVNIHSVVGSGDVMMNSVTKQEGISLDNKKGMEEGSKMANPNDVAYEQARKKMLPPYDMNADAPHKVYDATLIAGEACWTKATRVVNHVLEKKSNGEDFGEGEDWISALLGKGRRPYSIVNLLKSIDTGKKSAAHRVKAAFLLFMALKLHSKLGQRGVIEGASLDDCITGQYPHEVGVRLFELFTSPRDNGNGYVASKQQKDKLRAHMFILYAIASSKEMKVASINNLCKDMKMDVKDASLVIREAGFITKKFGTGDTGASLPVPLKFPPPKRGKRT